MSKMPSSHSRADLMVGDSSSILKRFYFLQRELVLAQAGWIPGTYHWETKLLWPEFLWQDSQIAAELRGRVLELRFPERRIEPGPDAPLLTLWRELLRNAPTDCAFARAMEKAFKPFLRQAFGAYLARADAIDDAPTLRILRQALEDIDDQSAKLRNAAEDSGKVYDEEALKGAKAWADAVVQSLDQIGTNALFCQEVPEIEPVNQVAEGGKPFMIARQGCRDPRFAYSRIPWPDSLDPKRGAGEGLELQIRQAQAHLNEIWATEMAAAVIFDLAEDAPPEFLKDAARWCYDESRHCRMGYTRFLEWGFEKHEMPLGSFSYDAGGKVDALTRLGIIFYFETTYIHTKSERTRSFAAFGDRTSSHDMDYDWADELIHTHYGKKWLNYFLETSGDSRTLNDIRKTAQEAVELTRAETTAAEKQRIEELYLTTLRRARELALVSQSA